MKLENTISFEESGWIEEFRKKNKRSPRVLHIGNIANNAYINSKIMNRAGVKCDVLCYDYYHIMGCPEWEDADFEGIIKDDFAPDWKSVNLKGFKRPKWFIQGPMELCLNYLIAKHSGRFIARLKFQFLLKLFMLINFRQNYRKFIQNHDKTYRVLSKMYKLFIHAKSASYKTAIVNLMKRNMDRLFTLLRWKFPIGSVMFLLISTLASPIALVLCIIVGILFVFLKILKIIVLCGVRFIRFVFKPHLAEETEKLSDNNVQWYFASHANHLIDLFKEDFPGRSDQLTMNDLEMYRNIVYKWKELFKYYDLIHGYATDGVWGLLTEKSYVAYEHGTIRNIPFQDTVQGRLCALTYREADRVCITNADNIKAAIKLRLNNYGFIPHPINEDFMKNDKITTELERELHSSLDSDFIIFHPSRQHWEEQRHPDWEKGNDIFIKGFAEFIKCVNPRGAAILVDWGAKVEQSKELLVKLGVANRVKWIKPLPNRMMIRYIRATDMLADQFYLGAFGSTMPKALACGKPSMLYLDCSLHRWCFEEMPPVLNTRTEQDVFSELKKLYLNSEWRSKLCKDGLAWYEKYHSNKVIQDTLLNVYGRIIQDKTCPRS
ncbi:MAG: glycosyltransferase [Bacillota bacterium]|nr:glycosyltransferase [Bacillota bacterium]